jgi:hypothetical protein
MAGDPAPSEKKRRMPYMFVAVFASAAFIWLIYNEVTIKRPEKLGITSSGVVDMCITCHPGEKLDPAHDPAVIGCSSCHLGNPLAITEEAAHKDMVLNPGDLRYVEKTCSTEGCHPKDVHKVKNSLMATNRGILGTLLYYWGESRSQDTELTVEKLLREKNNTLAVDYFSKLCATCHLWKQKNDMEGAPDFFNQKGGGCSACHYSLPGDKGVSVTVADDAEERKPEKKLHPLITRKVKSGNCVRCHNRSGRIGISYMGIFESEGYGTPYEKGTVSSKQLPGARFYLELADDVHHGRGMECIDCHTRNEIMGDGTSYAHYEDQLEISCGTCHSAEPGLTRKNNRLNNIVREKDGWFLKGKVEEKKFPLNPVKKGVCDFPAHKRVSCEACHSGWVAQCYGCHVKRDAVRNHLDKLTLEETAGWWEEGRSYIRYEKPMLGVWNDEVVVVTPGCQDIVTVLDKNGKLEKSFNRLTMAAINPHTTQAKGRKCVDCHASTKTLGLGEGTLFERNGELVFQPLGQGVETDSGRTVPLDGYVTLDGEPLQNSSRPELRPFNGPELKAILRVGTCVACHDSYTDKIWKSYTAETRCERDTGNGVKGKQ